MALDGLALGRGVRNDELERAVAVRHSELGASGAVACGVRQRLLDDPVRSLVDGARQRPRLAVHALLDAKAGLGVPLHEPVERGEADRRIDRAVAVFAQDSDHPVDLVHGLARHGLEGLERGARLRRILVGEQTSGA